MSANGKPSIIFCHGVWADGSSFAKLIPTLQAEGYETIAAQYGLDTLEGDVEATLGAVGKASGPAILVGHSYGGSVITAAGADDRVAGLVYISALAPDEDETTQSQLEKFPASDVLKFVEPSGGRLWLSRDGIECFAGDLTPAEKGVVWATQFPPAADLFAGDAPGVAWKTKPCWYIVATRDRTVQPDLERFLAKRMNATTYEVESSHVVMLAHPEFVLDVIRDAVAAVEKKALASAVA
jgi:pimeloyl-ACP methyl ester carboxylesterase